MSTLTVTCVTTDAGLHGLAGEWSDLWRRVPGAGPFQSHPWLSAWWSQFGTGRPALGVLQGGGRLLGLLPAYVLTEAGDARLLPIGAGISDCLDALIAPDAPPDAAARLLEAVLRGAGVDRCDLIELPPGSPLRRATAPAGWQASLHATSPCPVLLLPQTVDGLRQTMQATAHRKLRMNRHRAARAGGAVMHTADASNLTEHLADLFRLHEARWTGRGEPGGVLADPRVRAALTLAAPGLLELGVLRLAALRIGGELAAACMAFAAGQDLLFYMSGFAAEHASCSPGSLLLGEMAEAAIQEGRRALHFLRGDEGYKYAWGAADRHNATLSLVRA